MRSASLLAAAELALILKGEVHNKLLHEIQPLSDVRFSGHRPDSRFQAPSCP